MILLYWKLSKSGHNSLTMISYTAFTRIFIPIAITYLFTLPSDMDSSKAALRRIFTQISRRFGDMPKRALNTFDRSNSHRGHNRLVHIDSGLLFVLGWNCFHTVTDQDGTCTQSGKWWCILYVNVLYKRFVRCLSSTCDMRCRLVTKRHILILCLIVSKTTPFEQHSWQTLK